MIASVSGDNDEPSTSGNLRLGVSGRGDVTVVHVAGEVDMATAPQLSDCLLDHSGSVVVDLSETSFLDSTGIAVFVIAARRLNETGGVLKLRSPQDHVRTLLTTVGLADWIEEPLGGADRSA